MMHFKTTAAAEFTMFDADGRHMIELMGHIPSAQGALAAEDVPQALQRLRAAMLQPEPAQDSPGDTDTSQRDHVSLANRAYPLLQMLEAATAENKPVLWHH